MKSIERRFPGPRHRAKRPTGGDAALRVSAIWGVPEVLRSLGVDPAEVLAAAGIAPDLLDDPNNLISYVAGSHLFRVCVERTGCRHFGLLLGQRGGLHSLGLVGLLVKYSPDVGAALRSLVRYLHLHVQGAVTSFEASGDKAMLGYEIYQLAAEATDQIGDGSLVVLFNIMRALCGPNWKPLEVRFAHRRPEDVRPFRRFFKVPLRFDAERNALEFSADWLSRPLPETDPEIRRLLQRQIDTLEEQYRDEFPEQVRSVLRTALVTDHAGADQVAALFSMHSRTMNRRLNAFGTSFQELLDEGRYEIARQMLEDSSMDVSQIAELLDYADASAFTRAFRRWSGTTPAKWRSESRSASRHRA